MEKTEAQLIEESEERENAFFQKASQGNRKNPFEADVEHDIYLLLHTNPWDV